MMCLQWLGRSQLQQSSHLSVVRCSTGMRIFRGKTGNGAEKYLPAMVKLSFQLDVSRGNRCFALTTGAETWTKNGLMKWWTTSR